MAREVIIKIRDDLDRSLDATETIRLGVDDITYVLDLCEEHAVRLRGELQPYLEAAHEKIVPRKRSAAPRPNAEQRRENQELRKWARENGYEIGDSGQIPTEVREAYKVRHAIDPRRKGGQIAKGHAIADKGLRDQIRRWGRENGYEVPSRGFLPSEVVQAFEAAHEMSVSA